MPSYKERYGVDWPVEMPDAFIGMTVAKKWRRFRDERGIEFRDPWIPLIDAAKALVPSEYFRVSEWTEQHFHDWVMAEKGAITIGAAASGKSNDYGFLMVLDWMTDPFDTAIRLGSTDKVSLKSRSWESVLRYYTAMKRNKLGLVVPGKVSKSGYAIVNDDSDDSPEAVGEKAGIVGVAVNDSEDSGKLQGAHAKYVRLVIDELATITHHGNIQKAIANLRVGADFKFFALANPASWEDPSSQYCIPVGGIDSVTPDTGVWLSTRGYIIRHHDGLKSPALKSPEAAREFPFLITQSVIDQNLADCDGNADAPLFWQMVRGFPTPSGAGAPVVLDAKIVEQQKVTERVAFNPVDLVATAAGIDPAWSEGGDGAYRARCYIRRDGFGRPYLDFTDGLKRLDIHATAADPPVKQMRDQTIRQMRMPYEAKFVNTAIDASANQGLADDLLIYAGANCLPVNNSVRASEEPLRANDPRKAKDTIYDRGTEAWCVLAEFCKAGQVRGLPPEALRALTSRRFATRKFASGSSSSVVFPLRLESKDDFKKRFKHSPDECDACALAALAAKERLGFIPFGYVTPPPPEALFSGQPPTEGIHFGPDDCYDASFSDGDDTYEDD